MQKAEAEVEQYMEIVVLIICAVIIVAGIVLIIWLLRSDLEASLNNAAIGRPSASAIFPMVSSRGLLLLPDRIS